MPKHRIQPPRAIASDVSCSAPSRVGVAAEQSVASAKGIGRTTCDNGQRHPGKLTDVPAASPTAAAHRFRLLESCVGLALVLSAGLTWWPLRLAAWLAEVVK
jgi:hypothetical protein